MTFFALNVLLALVWASLWDSFTPVDLISGYLFGYVALWLARRLASGEQEERYFRVLPQVFILFAYFVKELVKSCLMVARDCISPRPRLSPAVFRFPIGSKSDLEIFVLANLITLTPGTLTLDVTEDKDALIIHSIYAEDTDAVIEDLRSGMELRVSRVFR
jgi:multicomponent Na+:H+ antiporter subunit E